MKLHGYWRSSAAYRVRIALNLKGLAYDQAAYDLRRGEQTSPSYAALQPQKLVPAFEADGAILMQSLAILEWLEERYPEPPLLPADLSGRAAVRAMAMIVACDIHPLNNMRVLAALRNDVGAGEEVVTQWIGRWIRDGFAALETTLARYGGRFAFGDRPTIADCCLVPQVYNAERFNVDLTSFPRIVAVAANARVLDAVAAAHPDRQPDADR